MLMIDPPPCRRHALAEHLRHLERAEQIDFDHPAEVVDRQLVQMMPAAGTVGRLIDAGVVHEDRRLTHALGDKRGGSLDGLALRDVALEALHRGAGAARQLFEPDGRTTRLPRSSAATRAPASSSASVQTAPSLPPAPVTTAMRLSREKRP